MELWNDRDHSPGYRQECLRRWMNCYVPGDFEQFVRDRMAQEYFFNKKMPEMYDHITKHFSVVRKFNDKEAFKVCCYIPKESMTFTDRCIEWMIEKLEYEKIQKIRRKAMQDIARYCERDAEIMKEIYDYTKCYKNVIFKDKSLPKIKKVIFNAPATIVIWRDGTKTVVKCQEGETYDKEKGLALCVAKKALGNNYDYYDIFKKWLN